MKSEVFVFHGTGGCPEENWFPWIKQELTKSGVSVKVPQFPTPEGQSLETWLKVMKPYMPEINKNTLLIAHSLGGLFLLRFLERLQTHVKAAIFVAPPIGLGDVKYIEGDLKFAGGFDFDWDNIKSKADNFVVFHSQNDPIVPYVNGVEVAKHLGVDLITIPNSGHFNEAAGYTQFPQLLEGVNKVLVLK